MTANKGHAPAGSLGFGEQRTKGLRHARLFHLELQPGQAHGGDGEVDSLRVASREQLAGECDFIDYVEVPPGCSIGNHHHAPDEEEFYLLLAGNGTMRLDDEILEVGAGDLVRNRPGGVHGLRNDGPERIRLLVFELRVRQEWTACGS